METEHLEARKAMMQWWSDYLEACRESYAPPYTIGKNKFIHSILTNPTLWQITTTSTGGGSIDFYQLHDEKHLFYPKKTIESQRNQEGDSIVFGQSGL